MGIGVPARSLHQGLTPHCCQAIRGAVEESRRLGQRAVNSEHLLLGLLGETDSGAAAAGDCGVDAGQLYQHG
ncbi:MAG: Clp protease N-terminal domain-containing protein [Lawsonibacter sp.]